jgi:uncharacterized alpha/beta hydrolase family protein
MGKKNNYGLSIKIVAVLLVMLMQMSVFGNTKVYLIHGFASPTLLMRKIERSIKKECYVTENYSYRSIVEELDVVGENLYKHIKASNHDTVCFVTHSMGALVVRSMLQYVNENDSFPTVHRIVMIAPPNAGAEIADLVSSYDILCKILGNNLVNMRTDSSSCANNLPIPENAEIGIVAGGRGKKFGYNLFINGDNDGYLTPEKTKLGIEKDFIVVKGEHAFLTQKKQVCNLILDFLKNGYFVTNC